MELKSLLAAKGSVFLVVCFIFFFRYLLLTFLTRSNNCDWFNDNQPGHSYRLFVALVVKSFITSIF